MKQALSQAQPVSQASRVWPAVGRAAKRRLLRWAKSEMGLSKLALGGCQNASELSAVHASGKFNESTDLKLA